MAKKLVIGESSVTASQLTDFFRQISEGSITGEMVQAFNERRNPFEKPTMPSKVLQDWKQFYKKYFGIELPNGIKIPTKKDGFNRLLVIAKGLTNNSVYAACEKHFPCFRYNNDLDTAVPTNERDPKNGSYAIWVRDEIEADEVHKDKSVNMIKEEKLKTQTLLERMLHELVYFLESKKHLDIQNWTLCSGSRDSDGRVPGAGWDDGQFYVRWDSVDFRVGSLRSREVVS